MSEQPTNTDWLCTICQQLATSPSIITKAQPCKHEFCRDCIETWVNSPQCQRYGSTCPQCRANITQLQYADGTTTEINNPAPENIEEETQEQQEARLDLEDLDQELTRLIQERMRLQSEGAESTMLLANLTQRLAILARRLEVIRRYEARVGRE